MDEFRGRRLVEAQLGEGTVPATIARERQGAANALEQAIAATGDHHLRKLAGHRFESARARLESRCESFGWPPVRGHWPCDASNLAAKLADPERPDPAHRSIDLTSPTLRIPRDTMGVPA